MSKFLHKAQHHAEKIDYLHNHAGGAGYAQARYHERKLEELYSSAFQSKSGKNDVPTIQALILSSRTKMSEMKKRENDTGMQQE